MGARLRVALSMAALETLRAKERRRGPSLRAGQNKFVRVAAARVRRQVRGELFDEERRDAQASAGRSGSSSWRR